MLRTLMGPLKDTGRPHYRIKPKGVGFIIVRPVCITVVSVVCIFWSLSDSLLRTVYGS